MKGLAFLGILWASALYVQRGVAVYLPIERSEGSSYGFLRRDSLRHLILKSKSGPSAWSSPACASRASLPSAMLLDVADT